ncbi:MAG: hypothetical protein FWG89_03945 [Treponema sp.]|nr:hypothetical protein [Treponema sp.]
MKTTVIQPHKSSLGMDANIAAMIIFIAMTVLSWVPYLRWAIWGVPLVFFFIEKESKFVKYQAITALIIGIGSAGISILLRIFRTVIRIILGWRIGALVGSFTHLVNIAITALLIYLLIMAVSYKQVELPVIGPIAEKNSGKPDGENTEQPDNSTAETEEKPLFCGECGAENKRGVKFCGSCGKAIV